MVRKGDSGLEVLQLQKMLNAVLNIRILVDGQFGTQTELAVLRFQGLKGLVQDGIVGINTSNSLVAEYQKLQTFSKNNSVVDYEIPLPANEYVSYESKKIGITLHHTVSDGNPSLVVQNWKNDKRGTVGTHFVIGREMVNGSTQYDGKIVQCVPIQNWIHHILTTRMGKNEKHNQFVNASYIGIELCSWGCLKYEGGKFYDFSGKVEIPKNQVCELETPFRTFKFWHKFTEAQLEATKKLCLWLNKELNLRIETDLQLGIGDWFELSWDAINFRRKFTTHTNFEDGKFDCFPQPELIATINEIYNKAKPKA